MWVNFVAKSFGFHKIMLAAQSANAKKDSINMDRNENGLPRATSNMRSQRRDCTGELRDMSNGNTDSGLGMGGCGPSGRESMCVDCLDTKPLAYSYNPIQRWQMLYTVDEALGRGTLFEELDKPLGVYGNE